MIKNALIFGAGIAVGLLIAKAYAKAKIESGVHDVLAKVGLQGGVIEELADRVIMPS